MLSVLMDNMMEREKIHKNKKQYNFMLDGRNVKCVFRDIEQPQEALTSLLSDKQTSRFLPLSCLSLHPSFSPFSHVVTILLFRHLRSREC